MRIKEKAKKWLAGLLAFTVLFSLDMPVQALAGETGQNTITVTVSAYDYTAMDAGVTGASDTGVIMKDITVEVPSDSTVVETIQEAAEQASVTYNVESSSYGPYLKGLNGLNDQAANYPASGWLYCIDHDYNNYQLNDGSDIQVNYTLDGGADINSAWDASWNPAPPTLTSFTLAGQSADLSSLAGSGTWEDPYIITEAVDSFADLSSQQASYTATLNSHYITFKTGEGLTDISQAGVDYTSPVTCCLTGTVGTESTYYKILVSREIASAQVPDDWQNDLWLPYDYKELTVGGTAEIYPRRVPEIVSSSVSSDVTRPNFNFEVVQGDSISLSSGDSSEKITVTAEKAGTSIVKVTYDSIEANDSTYGASSSVNTGYIVYNVADSETAMSIDTDISLSSYDTVYFTEGNTKDYSFHVTTEGAESSVVTCNQNILTQQADGSYVAPLENRSNIIGVVATDSNGNTKSYYKVVDARKIEVQINNKTNPGKSLKAGDTAEISFQGISMPVYKLATIYNPTWYAPSWKAYGTYVSYTNAAVGEVRGYCSQYDIATNNTITVTFADAGNYSFSGGHIYSMWWGDILGADKVREGVGTPNLDAGTYEGNFSVLPDFTISVLQNEQTVIDLIDGLGKITLSSKSAIEKARTAYDALEDSQKQLVTNYSVLSAAEKTYSDLYAASNIKVNQIRLNAGKVTLLAGQTKTLKAVVTPSNAYNQSVIWKSSKASVVTVSNGKLIAKKAGTAIITVTSADGSGKSASCTVAVVKPTVSYNLKSMKLQVKTSTNLLKAGGLKSGDSIASYATSIAKVVKVSKSGKLTATGKTGTATVTVKTKYGATATCKITVQKGVVVTKSLSVNKTKVTVKKGKTFQLEVTRNPINATDRVSYQSSNSKIATVSAKGVIKAKKKGTCTIKIKAESGKYKTVKVTVK